jgi:hypothetical protein
MFKRVDNYSSEFYTPPYAFLAAPGSRPQPAPRLLPNGGGLGACCSACAGHKGVGLFDDPFNLDSWGAAEYAVAALGAYALVSMFFTTRSAANSVVEGGRRVRRASRVLRGA